MRAHPLLALTGLLAAACSESSVAAQQDAGAPVWTDESQSISIRSHGFNDGSSGYERARAELTPAQLTALAGLAPREAATSWCGADALEYEITIVDTAGASRLYHATEPFVPGDDCTGSGWPGQLLSFASLQPFLDTFACISGTDTRAGHVPDVPLVVHPGDGCAHGLFMDGHGTPVHVALEIAAPGELTLTTQPFSGECAAQPAPRIALIDLDGATELATSTAAPTCASEATLTHAVAAAGTYFIEVSTDEVSGDVALRVR